MTASFAIACPCFVREAGNANPGCSNPTPSDASQMKGLIDAMPSIHFKTAEARARYIWIVSK